MFAVFPAYLASMVPMEHPVVTDVTDVMELKVIRDCRGRLDLRDLVVIRDFLVPRDLPVLKEIVDLGVLRDLKGHLN